MDRYRILFFTSSLRTGGAERHLLNLCRYLRSAGHEAAVCTLSSVEDGLERFFLDEEIQLFRLPLGSLRSLPAPRTVSGIRRIAGIFKPHIVHAHLFHAEVAAAFATLVAPVPLVATRHSAGLEFRGWRTLAARVIAPRFTACIAVSKGAAEEAIQKGFAPAKVVLIPNAVDPERFRPLAEADREKGRESLATELYPEAVKRPFVLIGSAGRLKPVKNYPLMLRVASRLVSERVSHPGAPELRFVIFGEGEERSAYERLGRELGIDRIFSLPGSMDNLEALYPLLDIFLLPSWSEGLPMALLEAMSSGVACVASDVGDVGEAIEGAGVAAPPGDENALVEILQHLITQEDKIKELGRKARVRVLERYNVDIWGERVLAVYRSVLQQSKKR
ncbi:MAG: glycosyltransferase [Candidatus Krumholzibacteriia bacterium]